MPQSNDTWIFDRGDIVSSVGMTTLKWVVTARGVGNFPSGEEFHVYHTWRLDSEGKIDYITSMDREVCNKRCIKVGTYDFENEREFDDG